MNTPTDIQIIHGQDGAPAFVVLPYQRWLKENYRHNETIPNEVVGKIIVEEKTPLKAWREYFGMTQAEVAQKSGISQAALSQMESGEHVMRKSSREKLARALGIAAETLL